MDSTFSRFEDLVNFAEDDPRNRASPRLKILIKNL